MREIRRILCAVDFSEASVHAIEQATALAAWTRAPITALHVYEPILMPVPGLPQPEDRVSEPELQRAREQTAACFQDAIDRGMPIDVRIEVGRPSQHILDCAAGLRADVIVMGTHGAGGFQHLLLGSVAERVLRRAPCAVLTVPPRAHTTSHLPFERLLCAVDFSDASLAASQFACITAQETGAALTLLHVIEWPWEEPPPPTFSELPHEQAVALAEYRRYLETMATTRLATLARDHPCAARPLVAHGKSYVEILRTAEAMSADLIVMGVHGRNPVDMMMFGSTANHVVRRATCPVMTLRQDGQRA